MAEFNPDEFLEKLNGQSQKSNFDPDEFLKKLPSKKNGPSIAESAIRKGAQGVTAGFSDEIAGVNKALTSGTVMDNAPDLIKYGAFASSLPSLLGRKAVELIKGEESLDNLKNNYIEGRDEERNKLKLDSETNPATSVISEIAGGFANPVNRLTSGMSLAKQGLALGSLYGAGTSEADNARDMALDTGKGAITGAVTGKAFDKVGSYIAPKVSNLPSSLANKISSAVPKQSKEKIIAAADRLGMKLTPAMLDDTGFVERLEYTLANSPSFLGQRVNRAQKEAYEGLQNAVKEATKDAASLSEYQLGDRVKSGITSKISERLDPISSVFNEVRESTKHIPVSQRSKDAIIRNIQNTDEYVLTGGAGKANQYVDMLGRAQNADQVKTMMSMLNSDIQAAQGAEKQVLMSIKNKLGNLEENSITRAAITQAKEAGLNKSTGARIGSEIVGELRDARNGYRSLMSDIGDVALDARLGKTYGPSNFLDKIENLSNESVQKRFFNTDNQRQLQNLAKNFPEEFELLRQGKLRDILEGSLGPQDRLSAQKFTTQVSKLSPEAQEVVFKGNAQLIDDITTLNNSLPRNFNPSGSGTQAGWQEALYSNVRDIPNYILYKGATSNLGKSIAKNLDDGFINNARDVTASTFKSLANPTTRVNASNLSTKNLKGLEKFAQDGANKVLENSDMSQEEVEQLKSSKKGKQFLIETSDYKDPKKIQQRVNKIRSSLLQESGAE